MVPPEAGPDVGLKLPTARGGDDADFQVYFANVSSLLAKIAASKSNTPCSTTRFLNAISAKAISSQRFMKWARTLRAPLLRY